MRERKLLERAAPSGGPGPRALRGPRDPVTEEALRLLVENIQDHAIFVLDPAGHVATWNAGAERLKGWRAEEIIGAHFSAFYAPEDIAAGKPRRALEIATAAGRFEDEGWRIRKDGSRFWANVVITAIRDANGLLRGFGKVTRDFTERNASEETARRLVAETAARRAAQAAEERALRAVTARDEFLAIAGHELKTPLTTLLFEAESLTRNTTRLEPGAVATRAGRLFRSAERLARLVDELLDVTHITEGRLDLSPRPVDLATLVREVAFRAGDPTRTELRVRGEAPVVARVDRARVEQVVENLVANALKYGGGSRVDVEVSRAGDVARITVRDHGIGIPAEEQARIFDRFERLVSSRHYGGLGLGLWIARQIVEAHGGVIRVRSAPGEGSEFVVELPLGAGAEGAP